MTSLGGRLRNLRKILERSLRVVRENIKTGERSGTRRFRVGERRGTPAAGWRSEIKRYRFYDFGDNETIYYVRVYDKRVYDKPHRRLFVFYMYVRHDGRVTEVTMRHHGGVGEAAVAKSVFKKFGWA